MTPADTDTIIMDDCPVMSEEDERELAEWIKTHPMKMGTVTRLTPADADAAQAEVLKAWRVQREAERRAQVCADVATLWSDTAAHWQRKAERTLTALRRVAGMLLNARPVLRGDDVARMYDKLDAERRAHEATREELARVRGALANLVIEAADAKVTLEVERYWRDAEELEAAISAARAALGEGE